MKTISLSNIHQKRNKSTNYLTLAGDIADCKMQLRKKAMLKWLSKVSHMQNYIRCISKPLMGNKWLKLMQRHRLIYMVVREKNETCNVIQENLPQPVAEKSKIK